MQNKSDSPSLSYLLVFGVISPLEIEVVFVVLATYKLCSCEDVKL